MYSKKIVGSIGLRRRSCAAASGLTGATLFRYSKVSITLGGSGSVEGGGDKRVANSNCMINPRKIINMLTVFL